LKKVDSLPIGPEWRCQIINITGNRPDEDGRTMQEGVELWHRDPVKCVKNLIGNPGFKEFMSYVPERVFTDDEGKVRLFDEMWTGDWWWDTQVRFSYL
jgi:Plavaka transposase